VTFEDTLNDVGSNGMEKTWYFFLDVAKRDKPRICVKLRVVTTRRDASHPVAPNVLHRAFTATETNKKWATDITYIPTAQGWLYLAVILDLYSRAVVGWSMSACCDEELVAKFSREQAHCS